MPNKAASRVFVAGVVTLTLACAPPAALRRPDVAAIDPTAPPLEYRIRYTGGGSGTLTVSVRVLAPGPASADIMIALRDWGGWTTAGEPYVRGLAIDGR